MFGSILLGTDQAPFPLRINRAPCAVGSCGDRTGEHGDGLIGQSGKRLGRGAAAMALLRPAAPHEIAIAIVDDGDDKAIVTIGAGLE